MDSVQALYSTLKQKQVYSIIQYLHHLSSNTLCLSFPSPDTPVEVGISSFTQHTKTNFNKSDLSFVKSCFPTTTDNSTSILTPAQTANNRSVIPDNSLQCKPVIASTTRSCGFQTASIKLDLSSQRILAHTLIISHLN